MLISNKTAPVIAIIHPAGSIDAKTDRFGKKTGIGVIFQQFKITYVPRSA